MVGLLRRGHGSRWGLRSDSRSHRRIAELREKARFGPERLEERKLLAVVAWDGEAGDGDFTNPLNWEGDIVPTSGDDAVIDVNGGPFIELKAGDFASVKSLVVDWPLAVNGTLGVADGLTVGAVFFDIGPNGRLESNNINLQPATGSISNQGEWTIGGTSQIDRRIVSTGTLIIAQSAAITLGPGLLAPLQYGMIEVEAGSMVIRQDATITGTDAETSQINVATTLTVDGSASFTGVGLHMLGTGLGSNARLNFGTVDPTTITDSIVTLEYALVQGSVALQDSQVTMRHRAIFFGEATIEGGTVSIRERLFVRPLASSPLDPASLAITGATITMGSTLSVTRLLGPITLADSEVSASNIVHFGDATTIRSSEVTSLTGAPGQRSWWTIGGTLTLEGATLEGNAVLWVESGDTLAIVGGTNSIGAMLRIENAGTLEWTGGDLTIVVASAGTSEHSAIENGGVFRAAFTGADAHALAITGPGVFRNSGDLLISFDDPASELVVNGAIRNRDRIEITGGTVRYQTGLVEEGVFRSVYGQWIVGEGGTLLMEEPVTTNQSRLTIIGDGQVPSLASMTLNLGTITLEGEGGWLADSPIAFRNWGTITKTGDGLRTIAATLTNVVAGEIRVESGHLTIDSPLFINRGLIAIGSEEFMSPRAVLRVTGDYEEHRRSRLEIVGVADGDLEDLPRLGVEGQMRLAGEVSVSITTTTPFTQPLSWQLGFAAGSRLGEFRGMTINTPGFTSNLAYSGQRLLVTIEV